MDIRPSGQQYSAPWHQSMMRWSQKQSLQWGMRLQEKSGHAQISSVLLRRAEFLCLHRQNCYEMLPGHFSYNFWKRSVLTFLTSLFSTQLETRSYGWENWVFMRTESWWLHLEIRGVCAAHIHCSKSLVVPVTDCTSSAMQCYEF